MAKVHKKKAKLHFTILALHLRCVLRGAEVDAVPFRGCVGRHDEPAMMRLEEM